MSFTAAEVSQRQQLSSSVVQLTLRVLQPESLEFSAGQWVDLLVPGQAEMGGYSICSSPGQYRRSGGRLRLAIRRSDAQPTAWLHSSACGVGQRLLLRPGGSFVLPTPPPGRQLRQLRQLLLLAGGVGVNPLLSMLLHCAELSANERPRRLLLLLSARSPDELLFSDEIVDTCARTAGCGAEFFVTGNVSDEEALELDGRLPAGSWRRGRVPDGRLRQLAADCCSKACDCCRVFVCGPEEMQRHCCRLLALAGLPDTAVRVEDWHSGADSDYGRHSLP